MTAAERKPATPATLKKLRAEFQRTSPQLDNTEGWERVKEAVIVGEKERSSGCFPAVSAVLVIAATIAAGVIIK